MELIRNVIEWIAADSPKLLFDLFPFLMLGIVGLFVLWLLLGYLRVSQVGIHEGQGVRQAVALPPAAAPDALPAAPRGVPYCAFDGLAYPLGARFCTACERDLVLDCATCGATLSAGDASCYRCGTPTGVDAASDLTA
ncbi:MAG TPA: zinc ribbon domain-containing protein [Candidatus Limnocylindria bacterium]|jgi:hypothetical protein|nr:zinc ribbon domain-containing protein [Candidatus Limnocylindria bacterium]